MLARKVVLVTGGAKRVGRAIATAFADNGARVAIHYRHSAAEAEALSSTLTDSATFAADLTDANSCRKLAADVIDKMGGLDILVNNAATFESAPTAGGDDDDFERAWRISLETNLIAPARLARLFAAQLTASKGAIVNMCDVAGTLSWPSYSAHGAAKAGLAHLTRSLAADLGPDVRVNAVAPGIAAFPDSMPADKRAALTAKSTLQRAGTPELIAEAVLFVATHPYISGVVLPVDGGWTVPRA